MYGSALEREVTGLIADWLLKKKQPAKEPVYAH